MNTGCWDTGFRGDLDGVHESGLDAVLHAEAGTFDDDGVSVVEQAVEDGGGDGGVVVEDGG